MLNEIKTTQVLAELDRLTTTLISALGAGRVPMDKEYLSPKEVELVFGIPVKTLADWRQKEKGPRYYRVGKRIQYGREDMQRYINIGRVLTTEDHVVR